ncbi:hypothetical protein BH10BAC3_BH10BAC3_03420 [soil metagenome]
MKIPEEVDREIAHHILSGSTTMIGVCVTVITLFRVMHTNLETYADELLAFDNIVFITAALFAYASIRKDNNKRLERIADITFLLGMLLMMAAGIMIIFSS